MSTAEGNGTKRERLFSLWHDHYHIIFALINQQTNKNKMNHYMPALVFKSRRIFIQINGLQDISPCVC